MRKVEPFVFDAQPLKVLKSESGVSLILVLVLLMILGLSAGIAGTTWSSLTRRAREADLLWKGSQIRNAIGSYYRSSHGQGAPNIFPSKLEYLLKDPRFLQTKRHLRRLYLDPMTGEDWVLIKDQGGRIKGVRSSFEEEPFKRGNFSVENKDLEGRGLYSEWEFVYVPKKVKPGTSKKTPGLPPGGSPSTSPVVDPKPPGVSPGGSSESPQG